MLCSKSLLSVIQHGVMITQPAGFSAATLRQLPFLNLFYSITFNSLEFTSDVNEARNEGTIFSGERTFCVMGRTKTTRFHWFGAEENIWTDKQIKLLEGSRQD